MSGKRVAILGGGVSGCSSALHLSKLGYCVSLFEMGRGCGGRASSRKTRSQPNLVVNHGAPTFDVRTDRGREIVKHLESKGFVKEYKGIRGILSAEEGFKKSPVESGTHFVGCSPDGGGGMNGVCEGLLADSKRGENHISCHYRTMVHTLVPKVHEEQGGIYGWSLFDKNGLPLGGDVKDQESSGSPHFDWIVIAGSGLAHPRWKKTFGYDAPLLAAISKLENCSSYVDEKLKKSLKVIGEQDSNPSLVVMSYAKRGPAMAGEVSIADKMEKALPFDLAWVLNDDIVQKVSVQHNADGHGGIALCIHSTASFAQNATTVFGKTSTAARIGGASTSSEDESGQIDAIIGAFDNLLCSNSDLAELATTFSFNSLEQYTWGPYLHRWGNCEPLNDPLAADDAIAPLSRVAFCGDYVKTDARMGSVEAALLSGDLVSQQIYQTVLD